MSGSLPYYKIIHICMHVNYIIMIKQKIIENDYARQWSTINGQFNVYHASG